MYKKKLSKNQISVFTTRVINFLISPSIYEYYLLIDLNTSIIK